MPDEPEDPGEDRTLPGEPITGTPEDIRHWVAVYRELYGFKRHLLTEVAEQMHKVTPEGAAELENDRKLLQRETDRVGRRLRHWEKELEKNSGT
jgi:hypothetical protein